MSTFLIIFDFIAGWPIFLCGWFYEFVVSSFLFGRDSYTKRMTSLADEIREERINHD